jgi:ComF family protein
MIKKLLDILFPRRCLHTGKHGDYLLRDAKKHLTPHAEVCPVTHKPSTDFRVITSEQKNSSLEGLIIWFSYHSYLKSLIIRLKYYHEYDVAVFLAQRLALLIQTNQSLQKHSTTRPTYISFIPSHRIRKYISKWYNQSEILAKKLSQELSFPYIPLAKKSRYHKSQTTYDRKHRWMNVHKSFRIIPNLEIEPNACIILVDDITTTWATIQTLAKAIKQLYPESVIRWAVLWRSNR